MKRRDFIKGSAVTVSAASACRYSKKEQIPALPHRSIDQELCIGCGKCVPLCPMGAIRLNEKSYINPDECAECGVCSRSGICPRQAIRPGRLEWPRTLRETFSNPLAEHESTGVAGRGTEGIKTNDSSHRYGPDEMGVFIELGRPVLGTGFKDVERVVKRFKSYGYNVVEDNPVACLVENQETGSLKKEIKNEKAISVLVEFIMPREKAAELMKIVDELRAEVETVFNLSVALRADPDGGSPLNELFGEKILSLPAGKVNLGLAQGIKDKREK